MRALNLPLPPSEPRRPAIAVHPGRRGVTAEQVFAVASDHVRAGRFTAALEILDLLSVRCAHLASVWNLRGKVLWNLHRADDAVASFERAVQVSPGFAEAHANRANALLSASPCPADRIEAALKGYRRARALGQQDPGLRVNEANALAMLGRLDEALACHVALEDRFGETVPGLMNKAAVLQRMSRFEAALAAYDRAIALDPHSGVIHTTRAALLLRLGQMREGWSEMEWRRRLPGSDRLPIPDWDGSDPAGRRILVSAEQGLGDTIQFARYAIALARQDAEVFLRVRPELCRLLGKLPGVTVVSRLAPLPDCDAAVPLMSLPAFIDCGSALPTQYLSPEPDRVARMASRLPATAFTIGIAWQGNAQNTLDHGRSIPLERFLPLAEVPGVSLVSLQKHVGSEQLDHVADAGLVRSLGAFDEGGDAFCDTAAAMARLDLVITSDTSVAHLAGALGRPVWIALQKVPDWRWMIDRDDSPWYPTARLFRQAEAGDWSDVFARIRAELETIVPRGHGRHAA